MILSHIVVIVEEMEEDIYGDWFGKRLCVHQLSVDPVEQQLNLWIINVSNHRFINFGMLQLIFGDTSDGVERFCVKEVRGISVEFLKV